MLGFAIILALLPVFALIWLSERLARLAIKKKKTEGGGRLSDPDKWPRCTNLPQPTVDPVTWRLNITGEVEHPTTLTLQDLTQMRKRKRGLPMHCAKGWVYNATWVGAMFEDIVARVKPLKSARWVRFVGADGYYECASLSRLMSRDAFLAYWLNDDKLPPNHGAPVRLIFPTKYGYKAVKWLTEISFVSSRSKGYLDGKLANYDADGTIRFGPVQHRGLRGRPIQKR
ncbi:MAG: molybdopterin-dependent oxidoreductase [Planctomycetes bacterium]|nr:molybdopterin-dependent oxidoreductase [Planctomycetota bacterium]